MGGMRRVPGDVPLADWVRSLDARGRLDIFYQTREWRDLRAEVLRDHPLCEDCLAKSPAVLSRAEHVHHVRELRDAPWLALSARYPLPGGGEARNLVALCHDCHDARHGRFKGRRPRSAGVTEERFD